MLAPDDHALGQAHRLLRGAFGKAELVSLREWRASLRERTRGLWTDSTWHLLIAERDARVVGVVSGNYLGNLNVGAIGYLAVSAAGRGLGLGPRLRRRLRTRLDQDARRIRGEPLAALVGEVNEGNPWLRTLSRRPEVLPLDFQYYQPRLDPSHRLARYVFYYESLHGRRRALPVVELRQLLYTLWRRVYRIPRPLSRQPFRRMMQALDGRRHVGRRKSVPPALSRKAPAR